MIDQGLWHYFKLLNLDCVDLKHEIMQDIFTLQLFWLQGWSMTINVFQRSIIIKISDLDFSIQKWFSEWLKLQKILSLVTIFCNQSLIRKHYQLVRSFLSCFKDLTFEFIRKPPQRYMCSCFTSHLACDLFLFQLFDFSDAIFLIISILDFLFWTFQISWHL